MSDLLFGVFSGDMGAMTVLFVMALPLFLVGYAIYAVVQKARGKQL